MTFISAKRAFKAVWLVAAVLVFVFGPGAKIAETSALIGGGGGGQTQFSNTNRGLRVSNYDKDCATCWYENTNAKVGETISFDVFYDNVGGNPAQSTSVNLSPSVNNGTVNASMTIDAQNASPVSDSIGGVNITDAQNYTNVHLEFVSGVWYKDQSSNQSPLPGGPYSFNLGNVGTDCPDRGDLIVRFKIVGTPRQAATCTASLTWDKQSVARGGSATETWSIQGADSATGVCTGLSEHGISFGPQSYTFNNLQSSMTCTVKGFVNGQKACEASATVSVNSAPPAVTNVDGFHDGNAGAQSGSTCDAHGWAADPDHPTSPVPVRVYIDGGSNGVPGQTQIFYTTANLPRSDLAAAGVCGPGNCAFVQLLGLNDGVAHNITSYAQDLDTQQWVALHRTDKSITCGSVVQQCVPPSATLNQVSSLSTGASSATLSAYITVGQGSAPVSYTFYYGTNQSNMNPVPNGSGSVSNSQAVYATLTGLSSNVTYYYKLVIQGQCGGQQTFGPLHFRIPPPNNPPPPPTCQTPGALNIGGSLPCIFPTPTCQDPTATNYGQPGACIYQQCVAPTATLHQTTVAQGQTSATISANIVVNQGSAPVSYTFYYGTDAANVNNLVPGGSGSVSNSQSVSATLQNLQPNTTYYYKLVIQGQCGGQRTFGPLSFTVGGPQCVAPTATLHQTTVAQGQTSATISANIVVNQGSAPVSYTFYYGTDANNVNLTIPNGSGSVSASQSVSATINNLQPNTTYYYRIVIQGQCGGQQAFGPLNFTVSGPQCTAPSATLNQVSVTQNQTNITVSAYVNTNSNNSVSYQFRLYDQNGSILQQTNLQSITSPQTVYGTFNFTPQPNQTYRYDLVIQGQCGGQQTFGPMTFTTTQQCVPPTVSLGNATNQGNGSVTLNGYVDPRNQQNNQQSVSYWFQYNGPQSGSTPTQYAYNAQNVTAQLYNLSPGYYTFTLTAQSSCGTATSQQTGNFTITGQPPIIPTGGQPPLVITQPATAIARNSALLNGQVNPNNSTASAWFTYATNPAVLQAFCSGGTTTNQQGMGNGVGLYNYSVPLTGLVPGTTYYFRAVGQNAYGTNCGQTLSFTTAGGGVLIEEQPPIVTTGPPVVITTVTGGVVGGGSCLILTPTLQPNNPAPGQEFIYGVTYRNDCPFDLLSASMRIYLPNEVDFGSTNYPFLTRDLNVITYSLGTIPRNFQNTVLVRGVTKLTVVPGDNLIFKADLSFTDAQRRLQTVSAFLNATVAGAVLGGGAVAGAATGAASVFATLLGFLYSPWFWFLLFLLLLALFILWLATRNRHDEEELEHA